MVNDDKKTSGKFRIYLEVKEFIDTGEHVELQPFAEYGESCWGWKDVKETIEFYMKRMEMKLNGG